ncbi:MAG: GWxTD domain-containing protein [Candidatus Aminicenantes bacterium]|nr:GWxTD domain-containing protein [Candidatus Aminicenantes bacterium]
MKRLSSKKRTFLCFSVLALALIFIQSCQSYRLKSKLGPEDAEFFSKVRYIITPEEKKVFTEIPPEERATWKEEFWKRRDPDLETEHNEFQETYFSRIKEANRLFTAGRPGWLTDRGEIFILLGPPTNIDKHPMGRGPGGRPTEVWYYGFFPVVFIDERGTGDYVRFQNDVIHIHKLNEALEAARMTLQYRTEFFDYLLKFERENGRQVIVVRIPFRKIWFKSTEEGGETILKLSLEVSDYSGQVVWAYEEDFPVKFSDKELVKRIGEDFVVRIPVKFNKGKYDLKSVLINKTGDEEGKKSLVLKIKD